MCSDHVIDVAIKEVEEALWQHIATLVMFQRIGKSYREFVDDLSKAIVESLALKAKLPHYATLARIMRGFPLLVRCRKQDLGTDSTGISCSYVSTYYAFEDQA